MQLLFLFLLKVGRTTLYLINWCNPIGKAALLAKYPCLAEGAFQIFFKTTKTNGILDLQFISDHNTEILIFGCIELLQKVFVSQTIPDVEGSWAPAGSPKTALLEMTILWLLSFCGYPILTMCKRSIMGSTVRSARVRLSQVAQHPSTFRA